MSSIIAALSVHKDGLGIVKVMPSLSQASLSDVLNPLLLATPPATISRLTS